VYMNGTIMGMHKWEIDKKLDEIVEFAGVAKYIDTPVKRYSSGMTVRLGFAVAAHLEPEILVVDEVLAVGDAEFQKKAIGKMQEVSRGHGRTVLFVSHNMGAVRSLCQRGIILKNGEIDFIGEINEVINCYTEQTKEDLIKSIEINENHRKIYCTKDIEILSVEIKNDVHISTNEPICLQLKLKRNVESRNEARIIGMINSVGNGRVGLFFSQNFNIPEKKDSFFAEIILKNHNLAKGQYSFDFNIGLGDNTTAIADFDLVYDTVSFEVCYDDYVAKNYITKWPSNWGYNCFKNIDVKII
jgi:lipopolysaccharide transport system ATP-binding protein